MVKGVWCVGFYSSWLSQTIICCCLGPSHSKFIRHILWFIRYAQNDERQFASGAFSSSASQHLNSLRIATSALASTLYTSASSRCAFLKKADQSSACWTSSASNHAKNCAKIFSHAGDCNPNRTFVPPILHLKRNHRFPFNCENTR